ncbi:hypothetical protein Zm00014a_018608 [Zea mays]|uniref:Uncharacterized protein n=1 Tax=Zea mays TaxID=4577 RepID=A0A3L6FZS5_MAIZE|nr:hypothetical protein Zm00014a_018608 [Zea mays]
MRYSSTYIMFNDTHTTSATTIVPTHKNSWPVSSDFTWQVGLQVDDELDDVMASSSNAIPRTTRESPTLATTMRSPCLTMERGAAALHRVQAAAASELVVHNGTCGHVGLFLEVELAVAKFLLVVDERPQRECLLLMVFVRGFQVRNMD